MDDLLYVPGDGLFYRLDPRVKLLFVISISIYLIWETAPAAMLVSLLGLHALALLSPSTRVRIGPLWKTILPLLITILFLGSLRWQVTDALLAVGPIAVTRQSLWQATGLAVRIAGLTFAFSLALWTTEPGDAVAALTRLGVPFELGFPVVMALQQIITFRSLFVRILEAQQSRGLILSHTNPIKAARTYIPVLVPLLINALRQVDDLSLALQSRGFGVSRKRTSRRRLRIQLWDWLFTVSVWACLFALAQV